MLRSPIIVIISLILALVIMYNAAQLFVRARIVRHDAATLQKKITDLNSEKAIIEKEIAQSQSPEVIEKLAKENLNLKKSGEEVAVIIPLSTSTKGQLVDSGSLWNRMKSFFRFFH